MTAERAAMLARRMQETVDFSLEHVRGGGIPFTASVLPFRAYRTGVSP